MKSIGQFIVHIANLAEAEGRIVKRTTVRILSGTAIFLVAGSLGVSGFVLLCVAAFLGLRTVMHDGWALGIVSIAPLTACLICALFGIIVIRDGKSKG